MTEQKFDLVIIGGGPGGLSAAIIAALRGMKVVVLESGCFGGLLRSLYPEKTVLNYPGFPEGALARDIADNLIAQARGFGVEMRNERVLKITKDRLIKTDEGEYNGKAVIIATGSRPKELGILGEAEFNIQDRGVYYYVTEKDQLRGKKVVIAGGGDTAIDAALELRGIASNIVLVHRRDKFRAYEANVKKVLDSHEIDVRLKTYVQEIAGEEKVEKVLLMDALGKASEEAADSVILAFGLVPNNEIFSELGLDADYEGRIVTDPKQRTNLEGIYAVGDIVSGTGSLELIVVAVSQGAVAAHHAYLETAEPYWG